MASMSMLRILQLTECKDGTTDQNDAQQYEPKALFSCRLYFSRERLVIVFEEPVVLDEVRCIHGRVRT